MRTSSTRDWSTSPWEGVYVLQAKTLRGVYSNPGFAVK